MVSEGDLREALTVAAQIVARDGPAYLPVFLRLEAELQKIDQRASALDRALAAAREGASRAA